jgi:hypothetical protein
MRWQQGRDKIDGMLAAGQLERVTASREHADRLLAQARAHVALATTGQSADLDPVGAYQLLYDAARKALSAVLENQGLRATSRGGHIAVLDAVRTQLDPPLGAALRPFDRMRRTRNESEYPRDDRPPVTAADVRRDQVHAEAFVELAERVLDQMSPY